MGKGATAYKVASVSYWLSVTCILGFNPNQVKTIKLLVSLANIAVGRIFWESTRALDGPSWNSHNRKNIHIFNIFIDTILEDKSEISEPKWVNSDI